MNYSYLTNIIARLILNFMEKVHNKSQKKTQDLIKLDLSSKLKNIFYRINGTPLELDLRPYIKILKDIKALDLSTEKDQELRDRSKKLREQSSRGSPPDKHLVEAYALVREASKRKIGLDPFDVQILAGIIMFQGKIAELPTGEGKTLAAVFPSYLNALSGKGVHVLTFNDYLARRDASWMGPIYDFLGLTVGCNQEGISVQLKNAAFDCDVTYTTAKEAGFDYLRDNLCYDQENLIHVRPFHFALVDEADSILIDESRIPLVIAASKILQEQNSFRIASIVKNLVPGLHFATDPEKRNVYLLDDGLTFLENKLKCSNLHSENNLDLLTALNCALHAETLLHRDRDYIVRNNKIEIIDEFTGRIVNDRHWPDGLQAAVEAKEHLRSRSEGTIHGTITLQHYFRLYPNLSGMTATARASSEEFKEFYGMNVVVIPPHKPCIRKDYPDSVYTNLKAKSNALVEEIRKVHISGRPILVGTGSVKESEDLAILLLEADVPHEVLNAKNDEQEARIIARAGMIGAVTISTNMAGRGTDIRLGGEEETEHKKVAALGGLYVIGTNRHESHRIDKQLRGRSGRQGDPGSTRFFISLEDDIILRYGIRKLFLPFLDKNKDGPCLTNSINHREIARAQRIIEGQNFEIRKSLWNYSSLIEKQRQFFAHKRRNILVSQSPPTYLKDNAPHLYKEFSASLGEDYLRHIERQIDLVQLDKCWADHLAFISDLRESIHLVKAGGRDPIEEFQDAAMDAFRQMQILLKKKILSTFTQLRGRLKNGDFDRDVPKGPSSTWTYLINDSQFSLGMELTMSRNIGYAAGAAAYWGPVLIFLGLYNKYLKRKKPDLDSSKNH